jgi:hypothetical protein
MEYWLTDAIKIPKEVRSRMAGYLGQRKIVEELNKYEGYPVEIDAHMDNKKVMATKLVKLEEKKLDKQLFEIPPEYKKEDLTGAETPKIKPQADEKKGDTSSQAPSSVPEEKKSAPKEKQRKLR